MRRKDTPSLGSAMEDGSICVHMTVEKKGPEMEVPEITSGQNLLQKRLAYIRKCKLGKGRLNLDKLSFEDNDLREMKSIIAYMLLTQKWKQKIQVVMFHDDSFFS